MLATEHTESEVRRIAPPPAGIVIRPPGRLDVPACRQIESVLRESARRGLLHQILDLRSISALGAEELSRLFTWAEILWSYGGCLTVVAPPLDLVRLLDLAGNPPMLPTAASVAEAQARPFPRSLE